MAVHGMQGRGVLPDLERHFGRERKLIGHAEIVAVMEKDGETVEHGDFLVLRTGFAELVMEMGGQPDPHVLHHICPVLNGRDQALLQWLNDSGRFMLTAPPLRLPGAMNYSTQAAHAVMGRVSGG
jgi:hypothetical protein